MGTYFSCSKYIVLMEITEAERKRSRLAATAAGQAAMAASRTGDGGSS